MCMIPFWIRLLTRSDNVLVLLVWMQFDKISVLLKILNPGQSRVPLVLIKSLLSPGCLWLQGLQLTCMIPFWICLITRSDHFLILLEGVQFDKISVLLKILNPRKRRESTSSVCNIRYKCLANIEPIKCCRIIEPESASEDH